MDSSAITGLNAWIQATNKSKARQNVPGSLFPSVDSSDDSTGGSAAGSATGASDPVKAFTAFMNETPAQRMQDSWLQEHGVTPDQFASMSADDKQKILDQMKRDMEERMKEKASQDSTAPKGSLVNILA